MISYSLCFALGVWTLQQQSALPQLPVLWPLLALTLLWPASPHGLRKLWRSGFLLLTAFMLGFCHAAWMAQHQLTEQLPEEWQGRNITLRGTVAEMPREHERGQRFRFDVEAVLTPDAQVPIHLQLASYHDGKGEPLHFRAGERWQLTVRLKQVHGSSNPHGFDFEVWALERNIRATGYIHAKGENLRLGTDSYRPAYLIQRWRENLREHFRDTLGEAPYCGILTALAIGDQSSISPAEWQLFTRTGVNHLMSISGLHITLLSGLVYSLCYALWRRSARLTLHLPARQAATLAGLVAALLYTLLAGFEVPAQRTLYMLATMAAMQFLSRNFSVSQLLSLALLVVLLLDPWAILSPGFWLSFGAVGLIFYVTSNRLRPAHWLVEYGKVQWAMSIGLLVPLLALFQQVSLVAPLANLFAIPLVSFIVVPLTLLGCLPFLGELLLPLAHFAMSLVMLLLDALNRLPLAVWTQHAPIGWTLFSGALGALWLLAPRGFPLRMLGLLLLLPMFLLHPEPPAEGSARITVFDVGQGLSVAIQTRRHTLLYDTGPDFSGEADSGNRILLPTLRAQGIQHLDGLILSHDDIDHIGGTASILQMLPPDWVSTSLHPGHALLAGLPDVRRCHAGDHWSWDSVNFDILHPDADWNSPKATRDNNRSCVLRISTGKQHVLIAGDIESDSERHLLHTRPEQLAAELLIAPHHGSRSSSGAPFIRAVSPRYVVFTSGYRNRFHHPHPEVWQRYGELGAQRLRSDRDGAILIELDGQHLAVSSQRQSHPRYWMHSQAATGTLPSLP